MDCPSVPALLATAHGLVCTGPERCFYCAAPCAAIHPTHQYVKDSFTGLDSVPCPGSAWVCPGCVLCLREAATVRLIDGTERTLAKCAMRSWSWLVTPGAAVAASKAHVTQLREICLEPPAPPFALVLADSGQKQLLYRGRVCHSRERVVVTLETERIDYAPRDLKALLEVCGRIAAASGKPALAQPLTPRLGMAVMDRYPEEGEAILKTWETHRETPLGRLAAWLCGNAEWCREHYPAAAAAGL